METGALYQPREVRLYADGTTDLFVNMGSNKPLLNNKPLLPGTIYFGGTMTASSVIRRMPDSFMIGIRFKPGGFAFFYKLPLQELADEIIEFPDHFLSDLLDMDDLVTDRLDIFFTGKIKNTRNLLDLAKTVENHKGIITVDHLAEHHHLSNRTLERLFNEHMGISPKEFIKVTRFQQVLKRIRRKDFDESFSQLAFETGYYDHAHLTNEVKRYSGLSPTALASLYRPY
ncbi:AraC-type DNA-binding protein [Dyadobacter sp. SG02]|nr:AraC-type DNA-binding protein [Dyadobacter sp. SG02]